MKRPDGELRLWLLDPKYKLDSETRPVGEETPDEGLKGSPKKVDIDKMHAYRDAIRGGQGEVAVLYAGILYPGETQRYSAGLAALRAIPGHAEKLHEDLDRDLAPLFTWTGQVEGT